MFQIKATFSIIFYVALLPSIIYCDKTIKDFANDVVEIAKNGGVIEGIFKPLGDKPLGMGSFGFAYRGILLPIQKEIAMKFTRPENFYEAEEEYSMYSYMEAINDTNVERFGIPVIYHYGDWNDNNLFMMGMSLFEKDVGDLLNSKEIYKHEVNFLIIIRDFILATKYMHSHAVRHDDVKLANMMIRKHKTFLIDFNVSSKMNERSNSGSANYLSRRGHGSGERYPKDDWESFLYSIGLALGARFPWLIAKSMEEMEKMKENTTATIEIIEKIQCKTLQNILVPFAKHVFDDGGEFKSEEVQTLTFYHTNDQKRFPDYNHWYKLVDDKIQSYDLPKPVMFSWLTPEEREEAIADLKNNPTPDITQIEEPKDYDYFIMNFPEVDAHKFTRGYKDWKLSSSQSFVSATSSIGSHKKKSKKAGSKSKSKSKSSPQSSASYHTCSDSTNHGNK